MGCLLSTSHPRRSRLQHIQPGHVRYQRLQRRHQPPPVVHPGRGDLQVGAAAVRGRPDPAHAAADDRHAVQRRALGRRRSGLAVPRQVPLQPGATAANDPGLKH